MILLDVNILIYAFRQEMPQHAAIKPFLEALVNGEDSFGVPEIVFQSVVRIVTQPKFVPPSTTAEVLDFCNAVKNSPHCMTLWPTERHWTIFDGLCRPANLRGKLVADAYLAAFAIDRDAEWITTDRDFHRFAGLRWRHPWESAARTNPR